MPLKILLCSNNSTALIKNLAKEARKEHYFHLVGLKHKVKLLLTWKLVLL